MDGKKPIVAFVLPGILLVGAESFEFADRHSFNSEQRIQGSRARVESLLRHDHGPEAGSHYVHRKKGDRLVFVNDGRRFGSTDKPHWELRATCIAVADAESP
jgi:hypothetical protein